MQEISALQPKEVWAYFEEILAIPRISKQEKKIVAYLERICSGKRAQLPGGPCGKCADQQSGISWNGIQKGDDSSGPSGYGGRETC